MFCNNVICIGTFLISQMIKNDPVIIGNRIKSVRMLAGYNRKAFSQKTGISAVTLRAWEEPSSDRHGITEIGVTRLIKALVACGVHCTAEWITQGIGLGPTLIGIDKNKILGEDQDEVTWDEEESILRDIESFKSNNKNPIVAIIADGSMLPFYLYGDYVGGSKRFGNEIISLSGSNCIVELTDLTIIRKLMYIEEKNTFSLAAINIDPSVKNPVLHNVEVLSAAKIIWHRSKEKQKSIIV